MKSIALAFVMTSFLNVCQAGPIESQDQAMAAHKTLTPIVLGMKGVNGIAVGGCMPETAATVVDYENDWAYCLTIYTETKDATQALTTLWPQGSKVMGILVKVENIGRIGAR